MFGHQYLQNCHKLFCDAVSATPAFNLKLCHMLDWMNLLNVEIPKFSGLCLIAFWRKDTTEHLKEFLYGRHRITWRDQTPIKKDKNSEYGW